MDEPRTLKELFPQLNDAQLTEAQGNIEQYLLLVLRVFDRLELDAERKPQRGTLTTATGTLPCTPPGSKHLPKSNSEPRK